MSNITNASLYGEELGPLIAQPIVCAYPISDFFGPTPRYLYYASLTLVFLFTRFEPITQVFLGAACTYAASAAIATFILATHQTEARAPELVTIPSLTNQSRSLPAEALTTQDVVRIQPDMLDLDLDAITAVVVTAYLIGLPLRTWSSTVNSSRIVQYMVLSWNIVMFGAGISALVTWPNTNTVPPQFRFCYASVLDLPTLQNNGWNAEFWRGSWNHTVQYIFNNPGTVWQDLSDNCFYPCFNTSQVLRSSTSLRATVLGSGSSLAKLHDSSHFAGDPFGPLVYTIIVVFTVAQLLLFVAPILHLCSPVVPTHRPGRLWEQRGALYRHFRELVQANVDFAKRLAMKIMTAFKLRERSESSRRACQPLVLVLGDALLPTRLIFDSLMIVILLSSVTLLPITVIGFICWIEWYIRNDGAPGEGIAQVGQWSVLVSVALVLMATVIYGFKDRVASKEELRAEIEHVERRLIRLRASLSGKIQ